MRIQQISIPCELHNPIAQNNSFLTSKSNNRITGDNIHNNQNNNDNSDINHKNFTDFGTLSQSETTNTLHSNASSVVAIGETHDRQCLFPFDYGTNLEIISGYWINTLTNSCIIVDNINNKTFEYCSGLPLFDPNVQSYTVYRLPHCYFKIFEQLSQELFDCFNNRPILFLGDSSMQKTLGPSLVKYYFNTSWDVDRIFNFKAENNNVNHNLNDAYDVNSDDEKMVSSTAQNVDIYFHWDGSWKKGDNHKGLTSWFYDNYTFLNDTLDPRYFKNDKICIAEVVLESIFHDITYMDNHKDVENVTRYRDRWVFVLYQVMRRIEHNAMNDEKCKDINKYKQEQNEPLFMLYIWTSYHTANIYSEHNTAYHRFIREFDTYYEIFLKAMMDGIDIFLSRHPEYLNHVRLIDSAYVSQGHYNLMYTQEGIHFNINYTHNVVSDMLIQVLLNHLCPNQANFATLTRRD